MAIALIFDCGATNLRTIAIDQKGKILASHHQPNRAQPDPQYPHFYIWDIEEIWQKLLICAEKTLTQLKQSHSLQDIVGIGVTTFGVDGAPFDKAGNQLYPIISWQCPRTISIMENLAQYLDVNALYQRNGIGQYSFNTLFKLLWLKENEPEILQKMDKFVFISSMLNQRLTGVFSTDRTMAGTSMMTDLQSQTWDTEVLNVLGLQETHFPPMVSAGEKIGVLSTALCQQLGLNPIPVISCGHDTQFAVFGSGAGLNQPVLSSGTWEILMARTEKAEPHIEFVPQGLTTEFDALSRCFNPAVQWIGSGVMEWVGKTFFADVKDTEEYYPTMIAEGSAAPVGSQGIRFSGKFNPADNGQGFGQISGLSMHSQRGEIYRAALEYMAYQLKAGLDILQQVSHFKAESLICVGGGSKNRLWNQIRADVLNLPIDIVDVAESTVLGAAMFTLAGVGVYDNVQQAQGEMQPNKQRIFPSNHTALYQQLMENK
ncbi:L-fuculokinase [uncultured Avibacterium sp.]|uniref:L-fuculokinase n=1 Tax=uncultured Avibacterium sp. TaxID=1936169 RepID=A0A486XD87_9PAST|nr:L-fuculokinase [uncultured Avibacterium sp.]